MDTFDFFVLHNPKVFDSQDTSALPVFFLSDVFFGNTAGSSLPRHTVLSAVSFLLCPSYSTLSAISASGFSVLTLKKKYNRWHTHTTAIQILPIGTFFTQIKPIAMTTVTIPIVPSPLNCDEYTREFARPLGAYNDPSLYDVFAMMLNDAGIAHK